MPSEETKQLKVETAIIKTLVKYTRKYDAGLVLRALRGVVNELNELIAEKNNKDTEATP